MESNYYLKYLKYKKKYLKLKGGSTVQRINGLWTRKNNNTLHTAQKLHEALSTFETSSLIKHFSSVESSDNFISVETRNGIILINIEDRINDIMLKYFFYDCYPIIKNYLEFYKEIIIEGQKFKSEKILKEILNKFNFKDIFIINLYFNTEISLEVSSDIDIEAEMNEKKILKSRRSKNLEISPYSLILTILSKLISDNENVIKGLKDEIKNWFNLKKINLENTILINVHGSDTGEQYRLKNNIIFNSTDGSYCYTDILLKSSLLNLYESLNTIFVGEDLDTGIIKNFKNPNFKNRSFNKFFENHYTEEIIWNVNNFIYEPKDKVINNLYLHITRDNYDLLICQDGKFIDYSEIFLKKTGLNYGRKIKLSDFINLDIDGSKFFENKKIIFITCRGSYMIANSDERLLQTLKRDIEQEKKFLIFLEKPLDRLRKAKELLNEGLIEQAEYDKIKKVIMAQLKEEKITKESNLKKPSVERKIWRNGNPKNSLLDGITSSKNKFKKKLEGLREYLSLNLEQTDNLIRSINKEIEKLTYIKNGTKYFYLNSYTQDYINHILHILQTFNTKALLSAGDKNKIYEYVNKGVNSSAKELKKNIALLINNL